MPIQKYKEQYITNFSNPQLVSILGLNGRILGASFTVDLQSMFIRILNNQISNTAICNKISENLYSVSGFTLKAASLDPSLGNISKDGLKYYFSVYNTDNFSVNDIFITLLKRNNLIENFSEIYYLDDSLINKRNFYNVQPYMTSNENMLIFVRNPTNSWSANDLWIANNSTNSGQYLASVSVVGTDLLTVGGMAQYEALVFPQKNVTNVGINWSVGTSSLASISGAGMLSALGSGVVTVTATAYSCCTTLSSSLVITILGSINNTFTCTCLGNNCNTTIRTCLGNNCQTFTGTCLGNNCNTNIGTCLGNNCNKTIGTNCKSTIAGAAFSHSFNKDSLV